MIKNYIREVPNFPKPGILFYDISTLLADHQAWKKTILELAEKIKYYKPDLLVGIESRGFLLAAPLAIILKCGFIMIRKKGKLPGQIMPYDYDLEYGTDTLEIQTDITKPHQRVVILDDLLATGGTLRAAINLVEKINLKPVASACIIELAFLKGREKIHIPLHSLIQYS